MARELVRTDTDEAVCIDCKNGKPADQFNWRTCNGKPYKMVICKDCKKKRDRDRYRVNQTVARMNSEAAAYSLSRTTTARQSSSGRVSDPQPVSKRQEPQRIQAPQFGVSRVPGTKRK